jgi:hypothetical protein
MDLSGSEQGQVAGLSSPFHISLKLAYSTEHQFPVATKA